MKRRTYPRRIAALALLVLTACGGKMSGTYAASEPLGLDGSLEFRSDHRVYVTIEGSTFVAEYELDGDSVIIKGPGGGQVYTREGDQIRGSGMTFVKE